MLSEQQNLSPMSIQRITDALQVNIETTSSNRAYRSPLLFVQVCSFLDAYGYASVSEFSGRLYRSYSRNNAQRRILTVNHKKKAMLINENDEYHLVCCHTMN
jgi:hypothetical protein